MNRINVCFAVSLALSLASSACGQDIVPTAVTDQNRTGSLPFSGAIKGPVDSIDLSGGGLTIEIPLAKVKGRGLDYNLSLRYSSLFWEMENFTNANEDYSIWSTASGNWLPGHVVGWETNQPYMTWLSSKSSCPNGGQGVIPPKGQPTPGTTNTNYGNYIYTDSEGTKHTIFAQKDGGGCFAYNDSGPASTSDGIMTPGQPGTLVNRDGGEILAGGVAPAVPGQGSGSIPFSSGEAGIIDTNGNTMTLFPGGVDTLGRSLVTQTQNGTDQIVYNIYDSNGNPQMITVNLTSVNVSTNFNALGSYDFIAAEARGTILAVSSIVLPNGQAYSFTYEQGTYGGLQSLTLPSGATINYTWATVSNTTETHRYVASRTVTVNGVTSTYSLVASPTNGSNTVSGYQMTVTSPDSNQQVYISGGGKITSLKEYTGMAAGTPVRETDIAYNNATQAPWDYLSTNLLDGALPISITKTLYSGSNSVVSQTQFDYDSFTYNWTYCQNGQCSVGGDEPYQNQTLNASRGNVIEQRDYDWGAINSGTSGALLRRTHNTFLHDSNPNYLAANIVDRLASQVVYDGSSNVVAQTQYTYDGVTPPPLSGIPQHTTPGNYRGNPTIVSRWRNTDGAWLTTTYTYDDTGNLTAITDPLGHATSWIYTDAWATTSTGNCVPTADSLAYPTLVKDALLHQKRIIYQPCTGQQQSVRDPNDLANSRAGSVYTYDSMDRPLTIAYADGGSTANTYVDTVPNTVTTTVAINSAVAGGPVNKTTILEKDTLGRDRKTSLTTDPDGTAYTRLAYDSMGRNAQEWNPTRCDPDTHTSCTGEGTWGITTHQFDSLGRETLTIPPDGTATTDNIVTSYTLNSTTVTDQAGISRASVADGLGRLIQVTESNMGWITNYTYDPLGNLTCVEQHGGVTGTGCASAATSDATSPWRVRRFVYNSLSQLLAAKNPEAGVSTSSCNGIASPLWSLCYTYNNDGVVISKTDARGYTINYSPSNSPLDALHRITQKAYSDGEPAISYTYDSSSVTNGLLHRTGMTDASGSTTWAYDSENRPTLETRTIAGITKTIGTQYNLDGSVWKLTYPSGTLMESTPGGAGRPLAVTDDTHSITYASGAKYAPHGEVSTLVLGSVTQSKQFNNRLQPAILSAATSGQTVQSLSFGYGLGFNDNGNVYQIVNNKDSSRSETFTYDGANRIATGRTATTWGTAPVIDAWGNFYQGNPIAGTAVNPTAMSTTASFANQLDMLGYDAAGNVLNDGSARSCAGNAYSFNAEEQETCAAGITYTFDGDGNRVKKSSGTLYWGAGPLDESDFSGNITAGYVMFGGKRIALRDPSGSGTTYYYFSDHLGSSNVVTNAAGTIQNESDFYPYGGERVVTQNLTSQHYKFTGKERDAESGLDYFGARYYASNMGRFMSPDWAAKEEPVPYAKLDDPQSLNLYAYVYNNPLSKADPDGHCPICMEAAQWLADTPAGDAVVTAISAAGTFVVGVAIANAKEIGDANAAYYANGGSGNTAGAPLSLMKDGEGGAKAAPNPNGSKGAPDHQATADEEAAKMGPSGQREVRVETPGGSKGSRVIDAAKVENGKVTEATQVVRPNKNGTPPAREVRAAKDIHDATGVKPKLVPVRPLPNQ